MLAVYFYLSHRSATGEPTRWQRWRAWLVDRYMSSSDSAPDTDSAGIEPVNIPVSQNSMPANMGAPVSAPSDRAGADIEAPNANTEADGWELPRVSRHISDAETIALLAAQRKSDGKHRYSANQIATLVGGSHNDVMKRVKELRADAPLVVFRPLTPEQQQTRAQLQLDQH